MGHLIKHQHCKAISVQLIHLLILDTHDDFLLIQRQNFCAAVFFVEGIFDDCMALCPHELRHNVVRYGHSFLERLVFIHMSLRPLFDFSDVVGNLAGLAALLKKLATDRRAVFDTGVITEVAERIAPRIVAKFLTEVAPKINILDFQ